MERLLPDHGVEELDDLYTDLVVPAGEELPHLYLDMVASIDGAATIAGRTRQLGGSADHLAFRRLRETCDAILVGAGTVRVEDYGPPRRHDGTVERRRARGLSDLPTVVVVSASLALDPEARLFRDPELRPTVLTVADAPQDRRRELSGVAELVSVGTGLVDLRAAMSALADRGWQRVLCEGGPHLNAQLFTLDLVDELFLTVAPTIAGDTDRRIVEGPIGEPRDAELVELRHHQGELLLRYRFRH